MRATEFQRNDPTAVGRAKTVLVFGAGTKPVAVVSEIVVRISGETSRILFRGPVHFETRALDHLNATILPIVDRITNQLGIPASNYEVSVVNIGAAASLDRGIEISGFSSDLPMLLALLSTSLQIGLRQDLISTGHVASMDGDLAPVKGIPIKLEAALAAPAVNGFVFPDLERDRSLRVLTPIEYQSAMDSLLRHKGDIKILPVGDVSDALGIFMTDPSIVLGSLQTGFYGLKSPPADVEGPIGKSVAWLVEGNEKRFWDVLDHTLVHHRVDTAHLLLKTYVDFFLKNGCYPSRFGEHLFRLVLSLPPSTRTIDDLFPLISSELCIRLTQCARTPDMEDVRKLYKALFGEGLSGQSDALDVAVEPESPEHKREMDLLEKLLIDLSKETLSRRIGQPIDRARASYATDAITVKNGFEFNDAITAFYGHMFRHIGSPEGEINRSALTSDAIELVKAAFANKGGYNGALSEGKNGINGGMRLVFDTMTEHLKREKTLRHAEMVYKVSVDALDEDAKVRLMAAFMKRIGPRLPPDLREKSPEQLGFHWEQVIHAYSDSLDKVSELFRIL